jgi:hypothetical protein
MAAWLPGGGSPGSGPWQQAADHTPVCGGEQASEATSLCGCTDGLTGGVSSTLYKTGLKEGTKLRRGHQNKLAMGMDPRLTPSAGTPGPHIYLASKALGDQSP